jgi:hypothetical protein
MCYALYYEDMHCTFKNLILFVLWHHLATPTQFHYCLMSGSIAELATELSSAYLGKSRYRMSGLCNICSCKPEVSRAIESGCSFL